MVGAGLAGLTAARSLVAKGKRVKVLEAQGRVGGRTLSPRFSGVTLDLGGQWFGPTQDRIALLARELGVRTFKTHWNGQAVYRRKGSRTLYDVTSPVPPDPDADDATDLILELNSLAYGVSRSAPWEHPQADLYDGQTFETFKLANASTEGGRFLADLLTNSVWSCEPRDISLLHMLFYISSAGNETKPGSIFRLTDTTGGAQESRFVGGSQQLSAKMARRLGKRVVLGAPVRQIRQGGGLCRVVSDRGTWRARQVIVAVPPAVSAFIDYDPILPPDRAQLLQRFPQGSVIKVHAVYPTPFWRDEGLSGYVNSDEGPVRLMYDDSPADGSAGVLMGFIEGQEARVAARMDPAARRAAVLANLRQTIGPVAGSPVRYVERNWSADQWARGCYAGFLPPGALTGYGPALRRRHNRIHWAGTEHSEIWNGYMEGAIRSGEVAAKAVLARL